jgi:adenosine deaminase
MSGVSMTSETLAVAETFDLGWEDLEELAVNGARAAFLPWERRERLIEDVLRPAYGALRS